MRTYVLMNCAGDYTGDRYLTGFKSKRAVEQAVPLCAGCRRDLEQGYSEFEDSQDGSKHRLPIGSPFETMCGAEWTWITDLEYQAAIAGKTYPNWYERDRERSRYWARKKRSRRPRR